MMACAVSWCTLTGEHVLHRAWARVVQGDVAAGLDAPEHEGMPIAVAVESYTAEPRLAFSIIGNVGSAIVRLTPEATAELRSLLVADL